MKETEDILRAAFATHEKLSPLTYHILIWGYCKVEEYAEALRLLKLEWESAMRIQKEMNEKGFRLNAKTAGVMKELQAMIGERKPSASNCF
ncbi:unnamed protein product [Microthlaspi erraticum]|uniref:Uncharacterized protein n=1 Tax=Microthlaspi erraticum TaxID=1685480 RepID=A0A6D2JWU6_9BRAS|nr:unnamed protein product [Microthlaspi erraticum]